MIGVLELILCDIGNTTYHFLVRDKHKKYFLDEKVPVFDEEIWGGILTYIGSKARIYTDVCRNMSMEM